MNSKLLKQINIYSCMLLAAIAACTVSHEPKALERLQISANHRYFATGQEEPFFWLGDTGWLLFAKLTREEADRYLDDRKQKGFNVIQVMVLHTLGAANAYGDSALINKDACKPLLTEGNTPGDSIQYDYWDHVDYIVSAAEQRGLYMALVPIWGSNVKSGHVTSAQGEALAAFLARRYRNRPNIVWLNGGDIKGSDSMQVWNTIGTTLRKEDPGHLITFHPRGRTQSSTWFHNAAWLDFNMFQSGHRRYDQDTSKAELRYGEDNWRYVNVDYAKMPAKPTFDGEPSYENIPQGLHDTLEVRWNDAAVRRYGYWSVFAGGCGYTYGDNSVMQMLTPKDTKSAYGAKDYWYDALNDKGAGQMVHLKNLMLSRPYFERVPDTTLVADQGQRYAFVAATRGKTYAFMYTYTGRLFTVTMGKINGSKVKASWYNPRDGQTTDAGTFDNTGTATFDPPGDTADGNDWVLILDTLT